jgi:hypothetical protein
MCNQAVAWISVDTTIEVQSFDTRHMIRVQALKPAAWINLKTCCRPAKMCSAMTAAKAEVACMFKRAQVHDTRNWRFWERSERVRYARYDTLSGERCLGTRALPRHHLQALYRL